MALFTYNDTVRVKQAAPARCRPGELASVVGISLEAERRGEFLKAFPQGIFTQLSLRMAIPFSSTKILLKKAHSQVSCAEALCLSDGITVTVYFWTEPQG